MATAPSALTLRVEGYSAFMAAIRRADLQSRNAVRTSFRRAGNVIRDDAARRVSKYDRDGKTGAGYKVRVRARGIDVEQSIGKTTGKRGDYGSLQMRKALLPARAENADDLMRAMAVALDDIADHFNAGGVG